MSESKIVWEGNKYCLAHSGDGNYFWSPKTGGVATAVPKEIGDYFQKLIEFKEKVSEGMEHYLHYGYHDGVFIKNYLEGEI